MSVRRLFHGGTKHVDQVATGEGRGPTVSHQTSVDELVVARERNAGTACVEQVEALGKGRSIGNKNYSSVEP